MIGKKLLDITFNPQGYCVSEIQQYVKEGILTEKDIMSVFGEQTTHDILQQSSVPPMSAGSNSELPSSSTQLVFWGVLKSGKSMVIASLLSQKGMKAVRSQSSEALARITRWKDLFTQEGQLRWIPEDQSDAPVETYHVNYRKHWWSARYPLSFIEARLPYSSFPIGSIDKNIDQVHFFCLDCRKDIHEQAREFLTVIKYLEDFNYLDNTSGVYILVTKTDLMNAPEIYRDSSAQTLVTAHLPVFWQKVQEICYQKLIYNNIPIRYSVGDFVLKDLFEPRNDYAEHLLRDALLPKCQPKRTWLGNLLSKGRGWQTATLLIACLALVCWGVYKAFNALSEPPVHQVFPFDYKTYFEKQVKHLIANPYPVAYEGYKQLSGDLSVEHSIRLSSGERLLTAEEYESCDSLLVNAFAEILTKRAKTLFSSKSWSNDETALRELKKQVDDVVKNSSLKNTSIQKYSRYVSNYFQEVKPLLAMSRHCTSMDQIDSVEIGAARWNTSPYTNDEYLESSISEASVRAYESCSMHYINQVNALIEVYEQKWDDAWLLEKPFIYFIDRRELKQNLRPLHTTVKQLLDRIDMKDSPEYAVIRDSITATLETMNKYL